MTSPIEFIDESVKLAQTMVRVYDDLILFSELTTRMRIPQFLTETKLSLSRDFIHNFRLEYPVISDSFEYGKVDSHSVLRFQNMMYELYTMFNKFKENKFLVKLDKDRTKLRNQVTAVIEDIVSVMYGTMSIGDIPNGNVTLAIRQYCDKTGVEPIALFNYFYGIFEHYNCKWLPFEPQHEFYGALMAADPELVDMLEDTGYMISDIDIQRVIRGELNLAGLMPAINEYLDSCEEIDLSPTALISNLEIC